MLLTIALIALLAGVLIGGAAHLLTEKPVTTDEVFWKAVQESRKRALNAEHEMWLKFDKDKKQFAILDGLAPATVGPDGVTLEETPVKVFPLAPEISKNVTVEFLGASAKGANTILIGGVLLEAKSITFVKFYPDGTCMPFRLQVATSGDSRILSIDQWTCAQVLTPTDPNARPTS